MKAHILATTAAIALMGVCGTASAQETDAMADAAATAAMPQATGYFAAPSTLPFHAPDFTQISEDDYIPSYEQAMAIHSAEIAAIKANPEAPTFGNTIVALEESGQMLGRINAVFFALTGSNTTDRLDDINTEMSPRLTAHYDAITLDPDLFARVKAVYDQREALIWVSKMRSCWKTPMKAWSMPVPC